MAEGIDLPADLRNSAVAEVLLQELEAESVLVDDRAVVRRRLVVHAPTDGDLMEEMLTSE